jgi:hypothetical protein
MGVLMDLQGLTVADTVLLWQLYEEVEFCWQNSDCGEALEMSVCSQYWKVLFL